MVARPAAQLAEIASPAPQTIALSGRWTALGLGDIATKLEAVDLGGAARGCADATGIDALDTAGAWTLQRLLLRLRAHGEVALLGLRPEFASLLRVVAAHVADVGTHPAAAHAPAAGPTERLGRCVLDAVREASGLVGFVGQSAACVADSAMHPGRIRWRPILFNLRSAGLDALPIVALLSFLLGIVIAYQAADQLRQYGANIFVADLIGLSMLREFAPLITAIIIAGRSGSAYAAQIGTMAVTEEIDAMRTIGIRPLEMLVLPKAIALVIALPLLTVAADAAGVAGGMLMAHATLQVGYAEFADRFLKAVSLTTYLLGIAKAPVFAAVIVAVGCYQGFCTRGGADSVGRQTTRSVVQAIVLVIVADGLFSVAFSALDL